MTIASEISRLQWAKADICTAIENKWVTVWNITLDNYASCIDAIQWGNDNLIDVLVVWWGWGWGSTTGCSSWMVWWWGWAWWVEICYWYGNDACYNVVIWLWWVWCRKWWSWMWCNWWDSCFGDIIAWWGGWWWGWGAMNIQWCDAFNWWGWGWGWCQWCWWCWTKWNKWWDAIILCSWFSKLASGWWWWAMWRWQDATYSNGNWWYDWWFWWMWCTSNFTLESKYYWCWWVWTRSCYGWWGVDKWPVSEWWWWWNWMNRCSCGTIVWQDWQDWLVIVRYKTWCANYMWWSERCCWDYTFHYFGRDWTLECITGCNPVVEILLIWWWGSWGWFFWWWWWAWWVVAGKREISGSICVHIWQWWTCLCNWWDSCFWSLVAYWWWGWNCSNVWWWSTWWSWWGSWLCRCPWCWIYWQWHNWWAYWTNQWWWGGWGNGAWLDWVWIGWACFWHWWEWFCSDISWEMCWYAWWWAGWWRCGWIWWCWWGWDSVADGVWCNATYYWWWWGGWCRCLAWNWYQWILILRYPISCWYNITWWTKYECNWYCIHCFTSDWTLTVN